MLLIYSITLLSIGGYMLNKINKKDSFSFVKRQLIWIIAHACFTALQGGFGIVTSQKLEWFIASTWYTALIKGADNFGIMFTMLQMLWNIVYMYWITAC